MSRPVMSRFQRLAFVCFLFKLLIPLIGETHGYCLWVGSNRFAFFHNNVLLCLLGTCWRHLS
jgi:hypothetical protein